jgi:hypothetical protein
MSHVPAPPPKPQTKDERFLALLKHHGQEVVSSSMALTAGHFVCTQRQKGVSDTEMAQGFANATPGGTIRDAIIFIDVATEVYCPPPGT